MILCGSFGRQTSSEDTRQRCLRVRQCGSASFQSRKSQLLGYLRDTGPGYFCYKRGLMRDPGSACPCSPYCHVLSTVLRYFLFPYLQIRQTAVYLAFFAFTDAQLRKGQPSTDAQLKIVATRNASCIAPLYV